MLNCYQQSTITFSIPQLSKTPHLKKNMQVFSIAAVLVSIIAVTEQVSVEIDYDQAVEDYKVDVEVVNPENDDKVVNVAINNPDGSIIEMNIDELADSEDDYDIKINLIKDKQEPTDRYPTF